MFTHNQAARDEVVRARKVAALTRGKAALSNAQPVA